MRYSNMQCYRTYLVKLYRKVTFCYQVTTAMNCHSLITSRLKLKSEKKNAGCLATKNYPKSDSGIQLYCDIK